MLTQNDSMTLSQLQQLVTNAVNRDYALKNAWVRAEFSDLRIAGGHCYMELIEKDTAGTTRAKMRAMIWSGTLGGLRRKFYEATGRDIATGLKVLVRGSVTHHSVYGLSFNITDIDPSFTLGDMERLRREILERLTREGVIDRNKQIPMPTAPQRIAVISADGAAGYGDFMNQVLSNPEGFKIYTYLFNAVMQGERTAATVLDALDRVEMTGSMWDAVAIIRGGGATTDLNGFDNLELARRVATFPLPVIVGIGHERDRTVLDEVACVRCKTPTAAAAFIIDTLRTAYGEACELGRRICAYGSDAVKGERLRLNSITQTIPAYSRNFLMREKMRLSKCSQSLPGLVHGPVMRQRLLLSDIAGRLGRDSDTLAKREEIRIERLTLRLKGAATATGERERQRLRRIDDMLRLLSPQNTLRRGYSITRVDGHALTNPAKLSAGAVIETTLADGKITSKVLNAKKF